MDKKKGTEVRMKQLSDFKDEKGIEIAADVLSVIRDILSDEKNREQRSEKRPAKMFSVFMKNSPEKMKEIFAILSEIEPEEYVCDGAEAMTNMLILANDPVMMTLFFSQSQSAEEKISGSGLENTEAQGQYYLPSFIKAGAANGTPIAGGQYA